jgi:AraC family L-rhamnose operon transcriptional activator RhaR
MDASQLIGFSPRHHPPNVWWHLHEFYELAFVTAGKGQHFTAAGERAVQRGSVIFVPPGAGHGYRLCRDMEVYNCLIRASAADVELLLVSRDPRLEPFFGSHAHHVPGIPLVVDLDDGDLEECLGHLDVVRLRAPTDHAPAGDLGRLLIVLDLLARRLDPASATDAAAPRRPPVVVAVMDLIERDLAHPWTLGELSARLYISPHHLCHLFSHWVGEPPIAFVNRRRAEVAAGLLVTTEDLVSSIGASVGWSDPSMFSRAFRRAFGVSPRAYRDGPLQVTACAPSVPGPDKGRDDRHGPAVTPSALHDVRPSSPIAGPPREQGH